MKRSFIREILEHTSSDTISLAGGLPDALLFPTTELQRATHTVLADNSIWQYSTSTGYAPLKALIAKRYSDKGFPTSAEEILITSGSQQGLDIICRYHQYQSITMEKPTYDEIRFNYTHSSFDNISEGLERIASVLTKM